MQALLTRREIHNMWNGLQAINTESSPRKLAYAIARNRTKLESVVKDIEETAKPIEEFEERRVELARAMAKKDDDGTPIMLPNNHGYFVPDMVKFSKHLEQIKKDTGQDQRDVEVERLLDQKEEIDLFVIPFEYLPDTMRPDVMQALLPMVGPPIEGDVVSLKEASSS